MPVSMIEESSVEKVMASACHPDCSQHSCTVDPSVKSLVEAHQSRFYYMTIKFSLLHYLTIVIYELFYLFYLQTETHNVIIKA
jgi:hypothetical protein